MKRTNVTNIIQLINIARRLKSSIARCLKTGQAGRQKVTSGDVGQNIELQNITEIWLWWDKLVDELRCPVNKENESWAQPEIRVNLSNQVTKTAISWYYLYSGENVVAKHILQQIFH